MWFIGVDGGGTSTELAIINEHDEVKRAIEAPASNWNSIGKDKSKIVLVSAIYDLLDNSIELNDVAAICLSLSGVHSSEDQALVHSWIDEVIPNALIVVENDVVAALASGTNGTLIGVTCIAGTGMNCWGKSSEGKEASAGGMGPLLGDRGSGYAIGQHALDVCARANDGRTEKTALLPALLAKFHCTQFDDLIPWRYAPNCTNDVIASLALIVFDCAKQGDKAAKNIVEEAASELYQAIKAVVLSLELQGHSFKLVLAGSLWKNDGIQERVRLRAVEQWAEVDVIIPMISGARGAALVARNCYGIKVASK